MLRLLPQLSVTVLLTLVAGCSSPDEEQSGEGAGSTTSDDTNAEAESTAGSSEDTTNAADESDGDPDADTGSEDTTSTEGGAPEDQGFGDCTDALPCLPGKVGCIHADSMHDVCAMECETVDDCPAPPPGGDAPVECLPVNSGALTVCLLNCGQGQTCPDGMACIDETLCAWPVG